MKNICKIKSGKTAAALYLSLTIISGVVGVSTPMPAAAIYCSNCATFYQQMYEYAEAVNTALNTAEQVRTQIQQYQNMVLQGTGLPSSLFGSVAADLMTVVNIYNKSQALGRNIKDMDSAFNVSFPGFQSYLNSAAAASKIPASASMPDRYEKWSVQGRDNVRTALEAANLNTSSFESEDAQLARMVSRSQTSVGRLQAIQAGNEIASQNVQQLQKLRDLIATQINMQGNFMSQEMDRQSLDDAVRQQRRSAEIIQTGRNKEY